MTEIRDLGILIATTKWGTAIISIGWESLSKSMPVCKEFFYTKLLLVIEKIPIENGETFLRFRYSPHIHTCIVWLVILMLERALFHLCKNYLTKNRKNATFQKKIIKWNAYICTCITYNWFSTSLNLHNLGKFSSSCAYDNPSFQILNNDMYNIMHIWPKAHLSYP